VLSRRRPFDSSLRSSLRELGIDSTVRERGIDATVRERFAAA
jgi:hypothetical protein